MKKVINKIKTMKKDPLKTRIDKRLKEFKSTGKKNNNEIFKELCFCILTANFNAEGGIRIQKEIDNGFLKLPPAKLKAELKRLGHRFPNLRSNFILEARKHAKDLKARITSFHDQQEMRLWFAKNVKGLGMKESSHFLRNIGFDDLAIIDFHIIDYLADNNLIQKPKTITPKRYIDIEQVLRQIAQKSGTNLAELDLYMWQSETGKVLK